MCKHVNQEKLITLGKFLDSRFEDTWMGLPTWAQSDKAFLKKKWLTINCIKEIQKYTMSSDAPQFQPLIQLMEFPDPEQRQAAENVYKELQENDFKSFHDEVETKVQAEIQKIPKKHVKPSAMRSDILS